MATRRPRGRADHAPSARGQHPQAPSIPAAGSGGGGYGMFFSVPVPPTLARASPFGPRGQRAKPQPLVGPHTQNESNQPQDVDGSAAEKLAFDELLRVQRGRAEDVGRLVVWLGVSLGGGGAQEENRNQKRAVKYREEWRVAREDEVLSRIEEMEARDQVRPPPERVRKEDALRSHVRRSIHFFLVADRGGGESSLVGSTTKIRLSNDLFYAQQMDRLVREMDQQPPFVVVRQAIAKARTKFQQLLLGCDIRSEPVQPVVIPSQDAPAEPSEAESEQPETNLLDLYENVVDARSLAQPTTTTRVKKTPRTAVSMGTPSAAFLGNLEKQREHAERREREALAQSHWRSVCAKRIRAACMRYHERQRRRRRWTVLQCRTRSRAAVVLQTTFLRAVRNFRALTDLQLAVQRKHQGRRIATCCFWRWLYHSRCGFASYECTVTVTTEAVVAIVCIQSHWRRRRAARDVAFRRAFHAHRTSRRQQQQWTEWRRRGQSLAPVNQEFAAWHCHVAIEQRRVARELRREEQRFLTEWTRYEARLEKDVLRSKLPPEWIPQLDPVGGETFYLNVQTTKTSSEHPNRALLRQLLKKQRTRAEQLLTERQTRLRQYAEMLEMQSEAIAQRVTAAYVSNER